MEHANSDHDNHLWCDEILDDDGTLVRAHTKADLFDGHVVVQAMTDGTDSLNSTYYGRTVLVELHDRDMKFPPSTESELSWHDELIHLAAKLALNAVLSLKNDATT